MISRKILVTYISQLILFGFNALSLILVGRFMGPTPMGIIVYGLSIVGIFNFLPDLGFNAAHVKRVSEGKDLSRCLGLFISVKIGLTAVMVVVATGAILWYRTRNPWLEDPQNLKVVFVLLAYVAFQNLASIALYTFEAKTESLKQQLPQFIYAAVVTGAIAYVAVNRLGVLALTLCYGVAGAILLISSLVLLRGYPVGRPSKEYLKSYLSFGLPLAAWSVTVYLTQYLDKFLIGTFYNVDEVAFYYVGQQAYLLIISLPIAAGILLMPNVSLLHGQRNLAGIQRLTRESERYISMALAPVCALCLVFAEPIIDLMLGAKFLPVAPIFRIQVVAAFLTSINMPFERQIPGMDRPGLSVKLGAIVLAITTVSMFVVVPHEIWGIPLLSMGAIGGALVMLAGSVLRIPLYRYFCYRLTQTRPQKSILVHVVSAVALGGALYYLNAFFTLSQWYVLLPLAGIFMVSYVMVLFLAGELRKEDWRLFKNLMSLSGMRSYVASELTSRKTVV